MTKEDFISVITAIQNFIKANKKILFFQWKIHVYYYCIFHWILTIKYFVYNWYIQLKNTQKITILKCIMLIIYYKMIEYIINIILTIFKIKNICIKQHIFKSKVIIKFLKIQR